MRSIRLLERFSSRYRRRHGHACVAMRPLAGDMPTASMGMAPSFSLLMALCLFLSPAALRAADTVTLKNCLLSLTEEAQAPAQEAGVLVSIPAREGDQVVKGGLLAQIDDVIPQRQHDVARFKFEVAKKQASDDVDVRYAEAAFRYADAKVRRDQAANARTPGTVPEEAADEHRLDREKFRLSIEKARKDMAVAVLQASVADAELKAAAANIERRRLVAPLDGVVVELARHRGEWVQPGDTVMRLVRVDLLRVEGFLNAKDFHASEIQGRPVQVAVTLAHGQRETFPGKIVFVKPLVQAGGEFLVRAEVQNRRQDESWILSPGMSAEMTIQLK
jgi:multidrug efflux pump subunit AcrA (membrane-fusion protein)